MSLYYQDDHVTLYHGDCIAEHREWLDADVLVTDPPYGMNYVDRQGARIANDAGTEARDSALSSWGNRAALVFGTWKIVRPLNVSQVLIWDKWGGGGTVGKPTSPWAYTHEEIYVMGDWPKLRPGGRAREGGKPFVGSGVIRVANYNTNRNDRPDHPTPKPIPLMESLVEKCPPGVVADPFSGSGATLIAARNLGRKSIGVELEEKYCEIIAKRLDQQVIDFEALM